MTISPNPPVRKEVMVNISLERMTRDLRSMRYQPRSTAEHMWRTYDRTCPPATTPTDDSIVRTSLSYRSLGSRCQHTADCVFDTMHEVRGLTCKFHILPLLIRHARTFPPSLVLFPFDCHLRHRLTRHDQRLILRVPAVRADSPISFATGSPQVWRLEPFRPALLLALIIVNNYLLRVSRKHSKLTARYIASMAIEYVQPSSL
jgi:hypothetical protein